jgi:hypothetical protein
MSPANRRRHPLAATIALAALAALALLVHNPASARAGSYVVAQCVPGIWQTAPDLGYGTNSDHFTTLQDCNPNGEGLQIGHVLLGTATGTEAARYGAFVLQAPGGTCISGGTVYSRLGTENGIHGYLFVSPDAGAGVVTHNQNDDQLHLSAVPGGCWRFFGGRLECTAPNEGNRCAGPTPNAHMRMKQIRLVLTDSTQPTETVGGSMFSGAKLRGAQTITVDAADQGAGIKAVGVTVNGQPAAGDDLGASCTLLPEGMTGRMAPCPGTFSKTYTLNTEAPPFQDGANSVTVCVADYATSGAANTVCETRTVTVDALCPASPRSGGASVTAGFGNGKTKRVLLYGKKALIRGRVLDNGGNGVEGAQVCILGHMALEGQPFRLLATATTNANGGWSHKLNKGASRELTIAYRAGGLQVETGLQLFVKARATLHVSKRVTHALKKIVFSGSIHGPNCAERVVVLKGSVPGAHRSFPVRQGHTDALCNYRMPYVFAQTNGPVLYVFDTVVPQQNGYPYLRGRSALRFIKVRRCGGECMQGRSHKKHHHKKHHHKRHHKKHNGKHHHKHNGKHHHHKQERPQ